MFGFFRKRQSPQSKGNDIGLDEVMARLRALPPAELMMVGHGINLANSVFIKRHTSIQQFAALPEKERSEYFVSLTNMVEKLKERQDGLTAAAFDLFRMWLWSTVTPGINPAEQQQLTEFMGELSRQGDLGL